MNHDTIPLQERKADFLATVTFLTIQQGGRSRPVYSGYRPLIKFRGKFELTSGQQVFIGADHVNPGETAEAEITILWIEPFRNYLYPGLTFQFNEGSVLIGTGMIIKVFNKELEREIPV